MEEKPIEIDTWDGPTQYHFTAQDDPLPPKINQEKKKRMKKHKKKKVKKKKKNIGRAPWLSMVLLAGIIAYLVWPVTPFTYVPLAKVSVDWKNCQNSKSLSPLIVKSLKFHLKQHAHMKVLCMNNLQTKQSCEQQCVLKGRYEQFYYMKNPKIVKHTETCALLEWKDADDHSLRSEICGVTALALKSSLLYKQ